MNNKPIKQGSSKNIKYKNAFNDQKELISITDIDPTIKRFKGQFICIGCGHELIAKLGKVNQHHFAHKENVDCSRESYLHKLGKLNFIRGWNNAVESHMPYPMTFVCHRVCTGDKRIECSYHYEDVKTFDILNTFDTIGEEVRYKGFVADVLLSSSRNPDKVLFIEIKVSHACSDKKIQADIPMLEIEISSEEDADVLLTHDFVSIEYKLISERINFKRISATIKPNDSLCSRCTSETEVAVLYMSGKMYIGKTDSSRLRNSLNNGAAVYFEILPSMNQYSELDIIIKLINEAKKRGMLYKTTSCLTCEHLKNVWGTDVLNTKHMGALCEKKGRVLSGYAVTCKEHSKSKYPRIASKNISCSYFLSMAKKIGIDIDERQKFLLMLNR